MTRFTQNNAEIMHLIDIQKNLPIGGILQINFRDGTVFEGVARGANSGNNFQGGMLRPTAYRADISIQSIDGAIHVIDLLDVQSVINVWEQRKQAYIDAGLVTVVGW